ncbi:MAG: carbonic anhydrase [Oscillospiraceae bacterium]|jgi:carbonic anhydrase|nr:carbonic anhydrase [Oscillospiraceae bacterium]
MTPTEIIATLRSGNAAYIDAKTNPGDVSAARRAELANGQHPIAAVITCSDSRVVPEHIFSVGLGELFVIRTAGNVVSDFESGSAEYAAGHLGVSVIVVMGHTHCGAVGVAREGHGHGGGKGVPRGLNAIISEITRAISGAGSAAEAVRANVNNSVNRLLENPEILELLDAEKLEIYRAVYDIDSGAVEFF